MKLYHNNKNARVIPNSTTTATRSNILFAFQRTHVCVKVKHELQGMNWNQHDNVSLNIMAYVT